MKIKVDMWLVRLFLSVLLDWHMKTVNKKWAENIYSAPIRYIVIKFYGNLTVP